MSALYEEAGRALRDDHLYVAPQAEVELEEAGTPFDDAAQDFVGEQLRDASMPIYIALLPTGTPESAVDDIRRAADQEGTYLVFTPEPAGNVSSDDFPRSEVSAAADSAFSNGGSVQQVTTTFIDQIEQLAEGETGGGSDGGFDGGGALPLAILAAVGAGGFLYYRRNKRRREQAQLDQVQPAVEEDITAYGEELTDLELAPTISIEARDEYARALDLYETAKMEANHAEKVEELRPVTSNLEEGRWLLACVRARRDGEELPERRGPCFFDPRHGPSVEDIDWTPPGGVMRRVPACAADAIRIHEGDDPDSRLVTVNGERRPYWDAGSAYGDYAMGYYGAAMLPTILMGTMLGSSMMHAGMYGLGGGFGGDPGGGFDGGGMDGGGFDGGGFDLGGAFDF